MQTIRDETLEELGTSVGDFTVEAQQQSVVTNVISKYGSTLKEYCQAMAKYAKEAQAKLAKGEKVGAPYITIQNFYMVEAKDAATTAQYMSQVSQMSQRLSQMNAIYPDIVDYKYGAKTEAAFKKVILQIPSFIQLVPEHMLKEFILTIKALNRALPDTVRDRYTLTCCDDSQKPDRGTIALSYSRIFTHIEKGTLTKYTYNKDQVTLEQLQEMFGPAIKAIVDCSENMHCKAVLFSDFVTLVERINSAKASREVLETVIIPESLALQGFTSAHVTKMKFVPGDMEKLVACINGVKPDAVTHDMWQSLSERLADSFEEQFGAAREIYQTPAASKVPAAMFAATTSSAGMQVNSSDPSALASLPELRAGDGGSRAAPTPMATTPTPTPL